MTKKYKLKPSFNSAKPSPVIRVFEHYIESVKRFFAEANIREDKAYLAARLKEIEILWQNVVGIRGSDGPKGDGIYRNKRSIDMHVSAVMARKGITAYDVVRAKLFLTSTGRRTATPQFKRRID